MEDQDSKASLTAVLSSEPGEVMCELLLESVATGLAAVLMALWAWFLLDDLSTTAVLELLCVYTADCTVACSALYSSSSSGSSGSVQDVLPKTAVTNSLMHGVMKLASQVARDNSSIRSLAFSLLANLAISRDCKGVLLKAEATLKCPSIRPKVEEAYTSARKDEEQTSDKPRTSVF